MLAMQSVAQLLSHHLTALSETENEARYKEIITKILNTLFKGKESDYIARVRKKATR